VLHFLDTNILLYSISRSPDESLKRERAIALLDEDSGALSVQVLEEFYVQATRSGRADAIPHEFAAGLIEAWRRFRIQDMTMPILNSALRIRKAHGFSYWDSAVIAAARTLGCDRLYTEDLNHKWWMVLPLSTLFADETGPVSIAKFPCTEECMVVAYTRLTLLHLPTASGSYLRLNGIYCVNAYFRISAVSARS